jgi:hypothetical protein
MRKADKFSRWVLSGLLAIPLPLITYFYLLLHLGLGVPLRTLAVPALIFCAFISIFAAGTYWGTRARSRGSSWLLFVTLGLFALLCGLEFTYFGNRLGPQKTSNGYAFTVAWATIITVGGYFLDKYIGHRNGIKTRVQ